MICDAPHKMKMQDCSEISNNFRTSGSRTLSQAWVPSKDDDDDDDDVCVFIYIFLFYFLQERLLKL